jgi:hypothetical protein
VHFSVFLGHLDDLDRIKFTNLVADAAANANLWVNMVNLLTLATNGVHRAVARANGATSTIFRINFKADQRTANLSRAAVLIDVRFVFVHEMFHS